MPYQTGFDILRASALPFGWMVLHTGWRNKLVFDGTWNENRNYPRYSEGLSRREYYHLEKGVWRNWIAQEEAALRGQTAGDAPAKTDP